MSDMDQKIPNPRFTHTQGPSRAKSMLIIIASIIATLLLLAWLGLQVQPTSFVRYPERSRAPVTNALPAGLPAPVDRFYRSLYPGGIPQIESAVITGRVSMRIMGITFPGRFRFTHDAGNGYRHYIEATWFGLPVMKVNEQYLDGSGRLELPFGVTENEPKVDQGANLGLWAEAIWFPAILVTDARVRWQPVDETTALLEVPFGDLREHFVVRFDPQTGMIRLMESMRYKGAGDAHKILWLNEALEWEAFEGSTVARIGALTWLDEGTPWATFRVEDLVYNVDVDAYLRGRGL